MGWSMDSGPSFVYVQLTPWESEVYVEDVFLCHLGSIVEG